jgi:ABC-type lipoprotein release transport system permease subunit
VIFLMALRNILRNKKNSVSVVLLIGAITTLFFIGNSVTGNGSRGLKQSFVDNITGDVLIEERGDVTMNLFGANTPVIEEYFSIPVLSAHSAIAAYLDAVPEAAFHTSQVTVTAALEVLGVKGAALLCGIDGSTYFDTLPGVVIEEGGFPVDGYGAMITAEKARSIEKRAGKTLKIGEPLLFTSAGDTGFKIREIPLTGIYRYTGPVAYLNEVILTDAQTVRVLSSIQIATSDVEVAESAVSLLGQGSALDDMFDAGQSFTGAAGGSAGEPSLMEELTGMLAGNSEAPQTAGAAPAEGGDWNFIVVKLAPRVNADRFIRETREALKDFGAIAVGWRFAAGSSAILSLLVQMLFNAGVALVSVACVLAVLNILLIAVFRRTKEIGTLRAIGARGGYIRALILSENCVLGFIAGTLGIAAGAAVIKAVNNARIYLSNELLSSVLGGETLHIAFSPELALLSMFAALALSVLSSLYPVEMAVKIAPIVAVQSG